MSAPAAKAAALDDDAGTIALVANYESDVGYAWWLMENFWVLISRQAQARGRKCLLAYPVINTIPREIAAAPIDICHFRFGKRTLGEALGTARFLRRNRVRSVYLTDWPYLHWSYLLWRAAGVRRIVIHDHAPGVRPRIGGLRGLVKRALYALRVFSADQYVAVSDYVGRRLLENALVPKARCVVVQNGIVPFDPGTAPRTEVRARIGVPADAFLVALVSRATYYKGIDLAVKVIAALAARPTPRPVYAVHCGDGPDLPAFRELAANLNVADRFLFLGRRDDVADILASSDCALHPSKGEAMCLAILEFMCAKLPVVASDNPSVCTAIEDGKSGVLYAAGNEGAAASALLSLVRDEELRTRLGAHARRTVLDRFSLSLTNDRFVEAVASKL